MIEDILGMSTETIPIIAYVDNKSVIEAVSLTKLVDDKRLNVDIVASSESLAKNEVSEIKRCPVKSTWQTVRQNVDSRGTEFTYLAKKRKPCTGKIYSCFLFFCI